MFVNSKKCNLKRITHTIESELKQNLMCVGERKGISVHFLVKFNKIRSKHKLKLLHLYLIESTIFVNYSQTFQRPPMGTAKCDLCLQVVSGNRSGKDHWNSLMGDKTRGSAKVVFVGRWSLTQVWLYNYALNHC